MSANTNHLGSDRQFRRPLQPVSSVSWDAARKLIRIAPLAAWSDEDVARYIEINALMINPLLEDGYTSIGCEPCTSKASTNDPRAGRWAGFAKTECGINL